LIRRNFRAEREAIEQTAGLGLARASSTAEDALIVPARHVPTLVSTLLFKGWVIAADQKLVRVPGPPALSVSSGIDWFELRGNVSFTGADGQQHEVSLPDILRAARSGRLMVTLGDGSQGMLPEQWLAEHGLLTAMGELHGDHLRFRNSQASLLDALLTEQELAEIDDPFRHAREALRNFEQLSPREAEPDFHGTLRTYQKLSLGWFSFLRDLRLGGILADDMGLGKTVQVLAMLHARSKTDHEHGPRTSLIVAPRSVVFNWLDEAKRFTPELHVLAYTGPDRQQQLASLDQYDLVVTSYGLLRRDIDALQNLSFDYAVLDEAQAIKNGSSQAAKAARLIQARHRLALTGTPVENHLGDLWSIFEYLNPGMLGSNTRFADLVKGATQAVQQEESSLRGNDEIRMTNDETLEASSSEDSSLRVSGPAKASPLAQLASSLRPFILRRTKKQVLTDLPAKTEQTILCEMDDAQRKIYNDLRDYYRGTLMNQLDANGVSRGNGLGSSSFMVLEALLRLRQAACHPALIDKDGRYKDAPSAKLDAMLEMLAEVLDEGQKALVFSQFTSMLGLVREKLDELGIRYCYLDGQTRNRKQVVEQFQNDPDVQVFLISLKAGGVGLNLTAAEYVFILDPWWNPAVEQQAIDRTHRIGQSKPVFAYRLVCEDTVEQHILELQQAKRTLAEAIVDGEQNVLQSLTRDDLERLLA
jgi:SNF2 family DNA or RNA helicase